MTRRAGALEARLLLGDGAAAVPLDALDDAARAERVVPVLDPDEPGRVAFATAGKALSVPGPLVAGVGPLLLQRWLGARVFAGGALGEVGECPLWAAVRAVTPQAAAARQGELQRLVSGGVWGG